MKVDDYKIKIKLSSFDLSYEETITNNDYKLSDMNADIGPFQFDISYNGTHICSGNIDHTMDMITIYNCSYPNNVLHGMANRTFIDIITNYKKELISEAAAIRKSLDHLEYKLNSLDNVGDRHET